MSELNKRLHDMRIARGLTLLEMAEQLGVKEATMQRYESGAIKNIKHETIAAMAGILGCTPAYLMGWDDLPQPAAVTDGGQDAELRVLMEKLRDLDEETLLAIEKIVDSIIAQRG